MTSSSDYDHDVPVSAYGANRRQAWLAGLRANADAMTEAAVTSHQADHDVVTAGQHGIFGATTGQQQAAELASRPVTVGSAWGQPREVERNGGVGNFNEAGQAIPPRADLRYVDQNNQPIAAESPLAAFMRGRG